jgi:hypothetical protein
VVHDRGKRTSRFREMFGNYRIAEVDRFPRRVRRQYQDMRLSGWVEMNNAQALSAVLMPGDRTRVVNRIPSVHLHETIDPRRPLPEQDLETRPANVGLLKMVVTIVES